ncbi:MAG: RNA polymerase sigma factor [Flavisolibacter sp.]
MNTIVTDQPKRNIIKAVSDYGKRLFYFIRGRVQTDEDAEDILQDVWYQFSNVMNTEPIEQVSAWLYRVARNKIIDQYRKQQSGYLEEELSNINEQEDAIITEMLIARNVSPEYENLREIFWDDLFAALEELPEDQRQVFIWHELEDIPFNEIAEMTGEKINTLISRKRYAVLHLRKRLEKIYKETIEH